MLNNIAVGIVKKNEGGKGSSFQNSIIEVTGFGLFGSNLKLTELSRWFISAVEISNPSDITAAIIPSVGIIRDDRVLLDAFGNMTIQPGQPAFPGGKSYLNPFDENLYVQLSVLSNNNGVVTVSPPVVLEHQFSDAQYTEIIQNLDPTVTNVAALATYPIQKNGTEVFVLDIAKLYVKKATGWTDLLEDLQNYVLGSYLLDGDNKIKVGFLPNSVMELKGSWNATTNTPSLVDGTGNPGDIYEVTTAGIRNFGNGNISFTIGDFVVYGANGKWYNSPNTFPTKVVIDVSSSIVLDTTMKGKTLRFTGAAITVTIPTGLGVNFELFLDNDTVSNIVFFAPDGSLTVFAPSGTKLAGGGTGYLTMTTSTRVSIKGDFID